MKEIEEATIEKMQISETLCINIKMFELKKHILCGGEPIAYFS